MTETKFLTVFITAPSIEVAEKIGRTLIEQKLAACVNILPGIRSLYTWKGQVNDDSEILLIVKTREDLFMDRLVPAVKSLHPYEVPEIIALPILMGAWDYLQWIGETTR